jgi:hypothetical protein
MNLEERIIKVFALLVMLTCFFKTHAQVSINTFLRSAKDDATVKVLDEQIGYLQGKPYRISLLNKLEVRAQNNEFYGGNPRYGVRVTPSNPWEVISNNRYYKTYQETLLLEKEIAFKEALKARYELVIEYLYLIELKSFREKDKSLLDAKLNVLEKQQFSDFFDVDDYVDLKLEQISKSVELDDANYELSNQISKIDLLYGAAYLKEVAWDLDSIISIDRIEKLVDSLTTSQVPSSAIALQDQKISLAKKEFTLEKSNVNLGFIQTQYTEGRPTTRSPWGISAGVTIPITNPNKGDMAKRQLEVIEAQNKKQETEANIQVEKNIEIDKIKNLITHYREIVLKISKLNINSLSNTLQSMNGSNPIVTIKLNSSMLKLQMILLKLKQDIFKNYVDFLSIHDQLQQRPLVNYLSAGLNIIDEN